MTMAFVRQVLFSIVCFISLSSVDACGGNFTSLTGIIQSPNFPSDYTNGLSCVYVITAPANFRITLNFTAFDLEPGTGCTFDYVEVRDGDSESSPRFGRYCNTSLPSPGRTFGNQMWVKFVTDGSVTKAGFRATYTSAEHQDSFFLITSSEPSSTGNIFRMDPETRSNYAVPISIRLYQPIAVDYDPVKQTIYWTEVGVLNQIRSASLNGSNAQTVRDAGAGAVLDGLAVDTLSRLIFYTDAGNDLIAMMTMSSLAIKTVINSSLDRPRAIVLDTADGVMFWTDWGEQRKIERASYDGSDRRTLVSNALLFVNALALDTANDRLYWADAGTDMVEMSDLNGNGRTILLNTDSKYHFFGLALFQDSLYITDWGSAGSSSTSSLLIRLTLAGKNATVFGSISKRLNDIHAYQFSTEMALNGCGNNNGGCSVICIPLPGNSSKCACPDGQSLSLDRTTCVDGFPSSTTPTTSTTTVTTTTTSTSTATSTITTTTTPKLPSTTTTTTSSTSTTTTKSDPIITTTRPTISKRPTTTTTSRTTPDNHTPGFPNVSVVVSASEPWPFDTDRLRKLTLTCDLDKNVKVMSYNWNVACLPKRENKCVFAPQPEEDDGKLVTCTATLSNGFEASGALKMSLNYPPRQAPVITGYSKDEVLQEGHILTMTCSVNGGKPLVTSVIFSCDGHSDTAPDVTTHDHVHSFLTINPLGAEDDGERCVCTAEWKDTDWYKLSATVILRVNGTRQLTASGINAPLIGGAAGGGVVVIIIVVVVVVVIMKKRDPLYDRPARKKNHSQENPYNGLGLGTLSNQPVVRNEAFSTPDTNDGQNNIYSTADENGGHGNNRDSSVYAELDEVAVRDSAHYGDYIQPVQLPRWNPTYTES